MHFESTKKHYIGIYMYVCVYMRYKSKSVKFKETQNF